MNYLHNKKLWLLMALVVSALVSQFSGHFNGYYRQIALFAGINVILAVSLNLINGYTGQFSLGHAGFMSVGAYAATVVTLARQLPSLDYPDPASSWLGSLWRGVEVALVWFIDHVLVVPLNEVIRFVHSLPVFLQFPLALVMGGLVAGLAGLAVGVPSLRLRGDYLAIVTLGFGEIIRVIIQNAQFVGAATGLNNIPAYTTLFSAFALAAVTIYVVVSMIDSTYGRGFLTVRDDEIAAEAMGIDTTRYKVTAFVLGAFAAGVAGGLYAHAANHIDAGYFDFQLSIQFVIMVIVGGMGSTAGVAFAAILMTVLLEFMRDWHRYKFLPAIVQRIADNRMLVFALILIAFMLLRPQGLFGSRQFALAGAKARTLPKAA